MLSLEVQLLPFTFQLFLSEVCLLCYFFSSELGEIRTTSLFSSYSLWYFHCQNKSSPEIVELLVINIHVALFYQFHGQKNALLLQHLSTYFFLARKSYFIYQGFISNRMRSFGLIYFVVASDH